MTRSIYTARPSAPQPQLYPDQRTVRWHTYHTKGGLIFVNVPNNPCFNTYVGARYVPIFAGEWDNTKCYEPLTVVYTLEGNSYISTTYTPAGTPLDDRHYWVPSNVVNGQFKHLQETVDCLTQKINDLDEKLQDFDTEILDEFNKLKEDFTAFQTSITAQITTITTTITTIENNITALTTKVTQNETDIDSLKQKDIELQNQITTNSNEIASHDSMIDAIQLDISELTDRITALEAKVDNITIPPTQYLILTESAASTAIWTDPFINTLTKGFPHQLINADNGVSRALTQVNTALQTTTLKPNMPTTFLIVGGYHESSNTWNDSFIDDLNAIQAAVSDKFMVLTTVFVPLISKNSPDWEPLHNDLVNFNGGVAYNVWGSDWPIVTNPFQPYLAQEIYNGLTNGSSYNRITRFPRIEVDQPETGLTGHIDVLINEFGVVKTITMGVTLAYADLGIGKFSIPAQEIFGNLTTTQFYCFALIRLENANFVHTLASAAAIINGIIEIRVPSMIQPGSTQNMRSYRGTFTPWLTTQDPGVPIPGPASLFPTIFEEVDNG